jgi:hypothetical protein
MSKSNKAVINKSNVKLAGLKSLFINESKLALTSFGKGEIASLEKVFESERLSYERSPEQFNAELKTNQIFIKGKNHLNGVVINPTIQVLSKRAQKKNRKNNLLNQPNQTLSPVNFPEDQLHAKDKLEMLFYGKTFKDNIHIQIIYNILDIQKIISPHINDVIFALGNLPRDNNLTLSINTSDFLGNITSNNYENLQKNKDKLPKFEAYYNHSIESFPYFSTAFNGVFHKSHLKNSDTKKPGHTYFGKEDIYTLLKCLSLIRNSMFHYKYLDNDSIYKQLDNKFPNILELINRIYDERIKEVNDNFFTLNTKSNFHILFSLYDIQDLSSQKAIDLARKFYNWNVIHGQKNLGVSVRFLRENLITLSEASFLSLKEFDTIRSKLYLFLDFIIATDYLSLPNQLNPLVEKLRMAKSEEDKDKIYLEESRLIWQTIKDRVHIKLVPLMNTKNIKTLPKRSLDEKHYRAIMIKNDASSFSKLMYVFSTFLDMKESNDLLSGLINKFSEIASMNNLLNESSSIFDNSRINDHSKLFEKSSVIAKELMIVKALIQKQKEVVFSDRSLLDAALTIGIPEELQNIDYVKGLFKQYEQNNFKNFLINNVVKSRRFIYLMRYVNPLIIKQMMTHLPSIRFILNRLPIEQIDRYIFSALGKNPSGFNSVNTKIDELANQLIKIKLEQFTSVVQGRPKKFANQLSKPNFQENNFKEKQKALLGLYLTVPYLFFKGLVNVNSRYTIALHAFERDNDIILNSPEIFKQEKPDYLMLTKHYLKLGKFKTRVKTYLIDNQAHFNANMFKHYRDQIAHLGIIKNAVRFFKSNHHVMKSYFEIYHTILGLGFNDHVHHLDHSQAFLATAIDSIRKYGTYSKDLLNVLHTPFAYNLPRYKNLSIHDLFDKNEITKEK